MSYICTSPTSLDKANVLNTDLVYSEIIICSGWAWVKEYTLREEKWLQHVYKVNTTDDLAFKHAMLQLNAHVSSHRSHLLFDIGIHAFAQSKELLDLCIPEPDIGAYQHDSE